MLALPLNLSPMPNENQSSPPPQSAYFRLSPSTDSQRAAIVTAWPVLPVAIKAGVLSLVQTAGKLTRSSVFHFGLADATVDDSRLNLAKIEPVGGKGLEPLTPSV